MLSIALLVSLRPVLRPGRDQRRGQIGDRAAHRLRDVLARRLILLLLQRAHAEHEPRDAMGLVELDDALGELDRLVDLAVDQDREERALEQHRILRVGAQRRAVIGRGRARIALGAGMARRQIVPRRGIAREFLLGRSLRVGGRGRRLRAQGRRQCDDGGERDDGGAPGRNEENHER